MNLTPELISAYQELLTNPSAHGLDIPIITECFEKSDIVTAKHILAEQYMNYLNKPIPKVVMYIVMDNIFGLCDGKDENQLLGYHLKFKPITP